METFRLHLFLLGGKRGQYQLYNNNIILETRGRKYLPFRRSDSLQLRILSRFEKGLNFD